MTLVPQGFRVLLDLGYGVLPRLFEALGSSVGDGLDAAIITHEPPDRTSDLHGLFRARWFGRPGAPAPPLFSPPGVLERVAEVEDDDLSTIHEVFRWHQLPAEPYDLGPFRLESMALPRRRHTAARSSWLPRASASLSTEHP